MCCVEYYVLQHNLHIIALVGVLKTETNTQTHTRRVLRCALCEQSDQPARPRRASNTARPHCSCVQNQHTHTGMFSLGRWRCAAATRIVVTKLHLAGRQKLTRMNECEECRLANSELHFCLRATDVLQHTHTHKVFASFQFRRLDCRYYK